jgi:hypothetical protein
VKSKCYGVEDAKKLPASIFACDKKSLFSNFTYISDAFTNESIEFNET